MSRLFFCGARLRYKPYPNADNPITIIENKTDFFTGAKIYLPDPA